MPDLQSAGFVRVEPRFRERDDGNQIWVLPWMLDILNGRSTDVGFSDRHADALNSRIIHGYDFSVSLIGDRKKQPEVERLEGLDEAWVVCYRKPRPGWRLFGRLYAKGLFMAVDFKDRHALKGGAYGRTATAAVANLESRFPELEPMRGNDVSDYFVGLARNVDKPSIY